MQSNLELELSNIMNESVPLQLGFDLDRANEIFLSYVIKHKRIIYGGLAINEHLKAVNPDLAIYNVTDPVADIDIYTPDPYNDAIAIADLLAKEFNYVQFIEAIHKGTFKIAIEFKYLYDLTYIPPSVFSTLPYREYATSLHSSSNSEYATSLHNTGNKIRYIAPDFMFIDIYKSFVDISNCWRWEKDYKRMSLLLEHCTPFETSSKSSSKTSSKSSSKTSSKTSSKSSSKSSSKQTVNSLIIPNGYTVTGVTAVDRYNRIVRNSVIEPHSELELYGDINNAITNFGDILAVDIVKVTHYKPYLNCLPESVCINVEDKKSKKMTVWVYETTKTVNAYTTFEETMLFLFSVLQRERSVQLVNYDPLKLINEMYSLFNIYNDKRSGIETDNPFKILIDTGYKFYDSVVYKSNIANYHAKMFTTPYKPQKMSDEQKQNVKVYTYIENDGVKLNVTNTRQ